MRTFFYELARDKNCGFKILPVQHYNSAVGLCGKTNKQNNEVVNAFQSQMSNSNALCGKTNKQKLSKMFL